LLPKSSRLRRILLAYTVNELGTWFGYVALALGVYDHTHNAIATAGLFVARGLLPALLAPVLVARTERSPRRGQLAWLYVLEAVLALALAALLWRFWLAGVLVLVAIDGVVAVAATALVRTAAARIASEELASSGPLHGQLPAAPDGGAIQADSEEVAQRQASSALNIAFMITLAIGPAIGGVMVHTVGSPVTLLIDALTFLICGTLLSDLRTHVEAGREDSIRARLVAAWRHMHGMRQLRILLVTEAVAIVFFASVEPVEVLYAKVTLSAGDLGFGLLLGAWGTGAALGAIAFARSVGRPLGPMLTVGTLLVGLAYLGFAAAPTLAIASCAALVGGVGNGLQWPALVSAVQRLTPASLHGRLMSVVGSLNTLCPAIGFMIGGGITALSSPRGAMFAAGIVATLATLAFMRLQLTRLPAVATASVAIKMGPEPGP
jgi:predicted MFS family arabinose efflux permease